MIHYIHRHIIYMIGTKKFHNFFSILNFTYQSEVLVVDISLSEKDILKNHDLDNVLELFAFLYRNKDKNPTIFTSSDNKKIMLLNIFWQLMMFFQVRFF